MVETAALDALAAQQGIAAGFHDIWGTWHVPSPDTVSALLACMHAVAGEETARALAPAIVRRVSRLQEPVALRLPHGLDQAALALILHREDGSQHRHAVTPACLRVLDAGSASGAATYELPLPEAPVGYHRLLLMRGAETMCESVLAVAPERCYLPATLAGEGRAWGPSVQLYALRSERNWGIGDFTDLTTALEQWAARGAEVVALNPLHALFLDKPEQASPYSPSSRLFLNALYLDVARIEDMHECEAARALVRSPDFQGEIQRQRAAELVDYPAVTSLKLRVLALLHESFCAQHADADDARAQDFRRFREAGGVELAQHALWEALQEHLRREHPGAWGWPVWPEAYRLPTSEAVAQFRAAQRTRIEFFEYLQWQADLQLGEVAARARALGLGVGLYGDLAVSIDRGGSEAWAHQDLYALQASVGAPPDAFNLQGQDWGLPPPIPQRLHALGYAPFIATLRRCMRHMGALRIDHVMGLMRLFWIAPGGAARDGAYVHYPLEDLLGLLALESQRNRCMVVGEDLGTVPDSLRGTLTELGVLSYRLLYFERDGDGSFKPPSAYPAQALAAVSTHDLPTLAGFWEGRDVMLRDALGLFPSAQARQEAVVMRADARARLLLLLEREGLLPPGATADPQSLPEMTPALSLAVHALLARSPCKLMLVQMEDVLGMREQANLPGTTDLHPNWRRRLTLTLEHWPREDRFVDLCERLGALRGAAPRAVEDARAAAIIPRATYRLQLNKAFTLRQATELVPYLARLGVSHVYCSPYLRARPGSTHGYDIVDHDALNPEIGDEDDLERFVAALRAHGMGQIVDIVPNHMGVMGADNGWWLDVLENGPASMHAEFFDIDWQPLNDALAGKVLLPVLGDHYGSALERGELRLAFEADEGSFSLWYHQHRFPLDPRCYPQILERALRLAPPQELTQEAREATQSLMAALSHLPPRGATDTAARTERNRDRTVHKRRLAELAAAHPALAQGVERALSALNGNGGEAASFDALHGLLEQQAWRLAYWRVASDEINYRRFFDINDLAGIRVEDEAVFEATHRRVLELVAQRKVDGLRIDHPDGLYDPEGYFRRLQDRAAGAAGGAQLPLYVVVEKITASHEHLPRAWAVHGTTGYRFANVVNGLFVDSRARSRIERGYRSFTGDARTWDEVACECKRLIMRTALASELNVLATRLLRIARADRHTRDFTLSTLRQALVEAVACFPVYRTYVHEHAASSDRRYIEWAIGRARRRAVTADTSVFDFLLAVLTAQPAAHAPEGMRAQMLAFTGKFQQFTAPVTAKGVEDTAFYRYVPLLSLNEVGGGPGSFGMSLSAFHRANQSRRRYWPHTMLATSTHDTKRSEDVRARIDVLSEIPGAWRLALRRWARINRSRKREVDGREAPSRKDEYLLYQTLIGSFPDEDLDQAGLDDYRGRIAQYMLKAVREAKTDSSWINIDHAYEDALVGFVDALLGRRDGNLFLDDFLPMQRRIARVGTLNSLAMTVIKLTVPGVPDIYRGSERIDLSLVDPDNRRPVDYTRLHAMLARIDECASAPPQGVCPKLFVTHRLLALRRVHEALFRGGEYLPLDVHGVRAQHLCAYARRHGDMHLIVAVPRLSAALLAEGELWPPADAWGDTHVVLAPLRVGALREIFTGRGVPLEPFGMHLAAREALAGFPVSVLVCGSG